MSQAKEILKMIYEGLIEIPLGKKYRIVLYLPFITVIPSENGWGCCYALHAKSTLVYRTDGGGFAYQWAAAIIILGFGIGFAKEVEADKKGREQL